jgi:putative heme transporter
LSEVAAQALAAVGFVVGALGGLVSAVFVLLIALYLIVYGAQIRAYALSFIEADRRPRIRAVTDQMGQRMGHWALGQLAQSTIIGVITFLGLTLIGVPGAVLLAFLAAIGEIIPILGPWLAAVPAIIIAFLQSPTQGFITLAFYFVLQQVGSYLIQPNVVGRAVKLNPLAVFLALLIGAGLLGIMGALVAVPVAAALAVLLDQVREQPGEREPAGPIVKQ